MKVPVLRATGGTARLIVRDAIAKGHSVVALVRSTAGADLPGAVMIEGDAKTSWRHVLALALAAFFVVGSLSNGRRSAGVGTDPLIRLRARLHRNAGGARDRHTPRRIRARGGADCRRHTDARRWLDHLAHAVFRLDTTGSTTPSNAAVASNGTDHSALMDIHTWTYKLDAAAG